MTGNEATSFGRHPRSLGENRYVYAVLARRSGGLSIGINLNPDRICNWDCIYCQVDRTSQPAVRDVDLDRLASELRATLEQVSTGAIFSIPRFAAAPPALRRLADIAFAGDGEPTSYPRFDEACDLVVTVKRQTGRSELPVKVLTNATLLDRPAVRRGLDTLARSHGEIWAKLDAGTEEAFRRVDRPRQTLDRCVELITGEARRRPVVIQSLFLKEHDVPPSPEEIGAWIGRLDGILRAGGAIRLVQITTVARRPALASVTMLGDDELDAIAARVRASLPGLAVETYYGVPLPAAGDGAAPGGASGATP